MSTQSVGERIAEKVGMRFFNCKSPEHHRLPTVVGSTSWKGLMREVAALIDQELLAAQKISGSETPIAPGLPREETGHADRDFEEMGKLLSKEWRRSQAESRYAAAKTPLWEIAAKYIRLAYVTGHSDCDYENGRALDSLEDTPVSSPDSRSTPTEEKQNPLVAPLVEALREAQRALEAASKLNTGQGCPDENLSVVVMAGDALDVLHSGLAQAGQEPPKD